MIIKICDGEKGNKKYQMFCQRLKYSSEEPIMTFNFESARFCAEKLFNEVENFSN